ncbi:MAG: polysaccharide deacetylase family protein [Armatimonadetes bacterium]|nr:polysaccharide deacetylase family protein [Armatimonadota bacterium]
MKRVATRSRADLSPYRRFSFVFAALAAGMVLALTGGVACRIHPVGQAAVITGGAARALASGAIPAVVERTEIFPVYAALQPSGRRWRVPGVQSTQRIRYDPGTGRVREIELALAEPLLVYSGPRSGENSAPRVALTFDDGPSAVYTPQMLEIMRKYNAHVTFFVLGCSASGQRGLVRQASHEGHEIGIHTWSHPQLTRLSDAAIKADLARCAALLDPLVERPIRWVRPPYGAHNKRVDAVINGAGYRVAMWSIDPRDWTAPGASVIANRILSRVRDGSVVVMHDGGLNRGDTVAAMRIVVPKLQERGFRLVTMSQLAGIDELPPDERGMLLAIGDEQFRIEGGLDDITVTVNGTEVELGTPPMKTRGQFLLHGRPVLNALGASCTWRPEDLTLEIEAPRGHFLVKLNSQKMTVNDREVFVKIPAVFYHDQALLPAWLIANACRAKVSFDDATRTIEFTSLSAAQALLTPVEEGDLLARRGFDGMSVSGEPYRPWSL